MALMQFTPHPNQAGKFFYLGTYKLHCHYGVIGAEEFEYDINYSWNESLSVSLHLLFI
jgi:hypothetical protein